MLAVERDVKPQNMNFAKVGRRGGLKWINMVGKGCMLYKVDANQAFRCVKLDPSEYDLLGLRNVSWYIDTCLCFGHCHGIALF